MSRLHVATEAAAGGDRVWLGTLGDIQGLRLSTDMHGDLGATWEMRLDVRTDHRGLFPGRRVIIPVSASAAWRGILENPQRGDVWSLTATGIAGQAQNYTALAATSNNALALNEVADAAIIRGWQVTRPATLGSLAKGQQDSGSVTVADALDTVTAAKQTWWYVNRALELRTTALPTALSYLVVATDTAGGRTVSEFATDVQVTYQDDNSYAATTITRSAASRPFGRVEATLDITDLGPISATQAQQHGDAYLTDHAARLKFSGAFTITPGQLLNPGGTPIDLATVTARTLVRVMLIDPDTAAGELTTGPVQIVAGQTEYDVDANVLYLTPLDSVKDQPLAAPYLRRVA